MESLGAGPVTGWRRRASTCSGAETRPGILPGSRRTGKRANLSQWVESSSDSGPDKAATKEVRVVN